MLHLNLPCPMLRALALTVCLALVWLAPADVLAGEPGLGHASTNEFCRVELPGVENSFQLTARIFSGSQPTGEAAFAALAKLGVKTIVSVDGARPDVAAARRQGLRYVHIPIGYDGITTNQALLLAKVVAALPGPIFVHCHHGKHRGPAAAAVMCEAGDGWTAAQAEAWLRQAGTSADYPGLYRAVRETSLLPAAQLLARTNALPETAPPYGLVAAMVELDQQWEELLAIQQAGYGTPPTHPDLSPVHAATRLQQSLHEFATQADTRRRGADFQRRARESESAAARLQAELETYTSAPSGGATNRLTVAYRAVSQSCAGCHKAHRNGD